VITDFNGTDFDPVALRSSTIHSRREDKKCIEGCMACRMTHDVPHTQEECILMCCLICGKGLKQPDILNWRSMTNANYDEFLEWIDTWTLDSRYRTLNEDLDPQVYAAFDTLLHLFMIQRKQ